MRTSRTTIKLCRATRCDPRLPAPVDSAFRLGSTFVETARMSGVVRVAAIGDLHCSRTSQGAFQPLFARIAESADILLIAGDLTDYGLPDEARVLSRELATARMPIVAVLGNHDLESAKGDEIRQILN